MANTPVRQYIGARYVPLFADPAEWDNQRTYEPLTIVIHNGNSYTSRQYVPAGIDINNTDFWTLTGNYNAQIEQYRQETQRAQQESTENRNALEALGTETQPKAMQAKKLWDIFPNDYVTVESFGAVGDGVTDDSDAINNAIANSGRKTVLFGSGTYLTTKPINIPSHKQLQGTWNCIELNTGTRIINGTSDMLNMRQDSKHGDNDYSCDYSSINGISFHSTNLEHNLFTAESLRIRYLKMTNVAFDNMNAMTDHEIYMVGCVFNDIRAGRINTVGQFNGTDLFFKNWYYVDINEESTETSAFVFNNVYFSFFENMFLTGAIKPNMGIKHLMTFNECHGFFLSDLILDYANQRAINASVCSGMTFTNIVIHGCGRTPNTAICYFWNCRHCALTNVRVTQAHIEGTEASPTSQFIYADRSFVQTNNAFVEINIRDSNQYITKELQIAPLQSVPINEDITIEPGQTYIKKSLAISDNFPRCAVPELSWYDRNLLITDYWYENGNFTIKIRNTGTTSITIPAETKIYLNVPIAYNQRLYNA